MATTLTFENTVYTKMEKSHKCFKSETHVIKVLVHPQVLEKYQALDTLIPDALPGPFESLPDTSEASQQVRMKLIAMDDPLKAGPVCNGNPVSVRVAMLLQMLVALLESLPSFVPQTFEGAALGAELFWIRDADGNVRLLLLNAPKLFKKHSAETMQPALWAIGKAMEYVNQNVTSVIDDPRDLLDDIRSTFRDAKLKTQMQKLKALIAALEIMGIEMDTDKLAFQDAAMWRFWANRAQAALTLVPLA